MSCDPNLLVLLAQRDSLRAALQKVLDTHESEARASAEREARTLLLTLRIKLALKSPCPSVLPRKPLDEHQVRMLQILPTHGIADVVRIVEAAHGITAPEGQR